MQQLDAGEGARAYQKQQGTCDVGTGVTLHYYIYTIPASAAASQPPKAEAGSQATPNGQQQEKPVERVLMIMGAHLTTLTVD